MHKFNDIKGQEWAVTINVNAVKRVRDLAKIDLLKIVEDKQMIAELTEDPVKIVDVLYIVCKPQTDAAQIDDTQFGELLGSGDVIEAAVKALLEDLIDFFPKHRRTVLAKAMAKLQEFKETASGMAIKRLDSPELNAQMTQMLEKAINQPLQPAGDSSGIVPASSG